MKMIMTGKRNFKLKKAIDIPVGQCQCGCGEKTNISQKNDKSKGWIKGQPLTYVLGHANINKTKLYSDVVWINKLSDFEFGWFVGLFEGEGTVTSRKSKRKNGYSITPHIRIASTDVDTINKLKELIPEGTIFKANRKTVGGKDAWYWCLARRDYVTSLLVSIRLYCSSRRRERIDKVLSESYWKEV